MPIRCSSSSTRSAEGDPERAPSPRCRGGPARRCRRPRSGRARRDPGHAGLGAVGRPGLHPRARAGSAADVADECVHVCRRRDDRRRRAAGWAAAASEQRHAAAACTSAGAGRRGALPRRSGGGVDGGGFSATIDWGDGTSWRGVVVRRGRADVDVRSTKRYAGRGTFPITVTLTDSTNRTSVARSTAVVRRA